MQAIDDPGMSEWGNPSRAIGLPCDESIVTRSERGEVNHLSTPRKRKQASDSASSGERTRNSLNRAIRKESAGLQDHKE
jgi:hypothetical protein